MQLKVTLLVAKIHYLIILVKCNFIGKFKLILLANLS